MMDRTMKLKLLCYAFISFVGFTYLMMPDNAGISVPVFAIIQFACLYFLVPNRMSLLLYIPIFILSLNWFISGNGMWRGVNILVLIVLYSVMLCGVDYLDESARYFVKILTNIVRPFKHFLLPFKWCARTDRAKMKILLRVLIGLAICIPVLYILVALLASADQVFSHSIDAFMRSVERFFISIELFKLIVGALAGLYLFGLLYAAHEPKEDKPEAAKKTGRGDVIVLNIIMSAMLAVYTVFIVIQFAYLFAGANLPNGMSYTEYARRGFFELLFLSAINIFVILLMCYLTKRREGFGAKLTKYLCLYLCSVTVVLLVSSFYRMWLYNESDGLTRLRFMVFGFQIFMCLGLLLTFYWIIKPKFNIIVLYLTIALVYYLLLNIAPMDYFIAKDQVDRYLNGRRDDYGYVLTLSSDAAPQIKRLLGTDADIEAWRYFSRMQRDLYVNSRWQQYNLSVANSQLKE